MIKLSLQGRYKLIETKQQIKVLHLGRQVFVWINAKGIGEILVSSHKLHKTDCVLSRGEYRIYDVKNEPELIDRRHLELSVGEGFWQGYIMLTDLPRGQKKRSRIIPTHELISNHFIHQLDIDRASEGRTSKSAPFLHRVG